MQQRRVAATPLPSVKALAPFFRASICVTLCAQAVAGRGALRRGAPDNLGSGGVEGTDPLGTPLGDSLFPSNQLPEPEPPAINHEYVPGSPSHDEGPSVYNPMDVFGEGVGRIGDGFATVYKNTGISGPAYSADPVVGSTCNEVCAQCMLTVAGGPKGHAPCECFANCARGNDPSICAKSGPIGWSSGDKGNSVPAEEWHATCNGGDRYCAQECLSSFFVSRVRGCARTADPKQCLRGVEADYKPPAANEYQKYYCTHKYIAGCQEFPTKPTNSSNTWHCYLSTEECEATVDQPTIAASRQSPSVWQNVVGSGRR